MRFELATPALEPALRRLAAANPMPGWVRLRYEREPDYFRALALEGEACQAIVARQGEAVVGIGHRSERPAYVNAAAGRIGYLGGLRTLPQARGGLGLARGYRFLRGLHERGRVAAYLTTIVAGNDVALRVLTSGRAGLPTYAPLGRYHAYAIPVRRRRRQRATGVEIATGDAVGDAALDAFLARAGRQRQFFPVVTAAQLGRGPWEGLGRRDVLTALRGGAVVGLAALWDQRAVKQYRVVGYAPWLAALRPGLNLALRACGRPALPRPGETIGRLCVDLAAVEGDDPRVLRALLERAGAEAAARGVGFLLLGLHERDPLRPVPEGMGALAYRSDLFAVHWPDGEGFVRGLDARLVPHLGIGSL